MRKTKKICQSQEKSSYKAHYRDVVSDMPGRQNEEFAEAMDTLFKNID